MNASNGSIKINSIEDGRGINGFFSVKNDPCLSINNGSRLNGAFGANLIRNKAFSDAFSVVNR